MATTATRFDAASDRATYSGGSGAPPTPSAGWAAAWWFYISVDQNTFATMLRLWAGGTVLNLAMGSSGTAPGAYTGGGTVEVGTQCAAATWYYAGYTVNGTALTVYVFDAAGALFATASGTIGGGIPTGLTVGGRDASNPDEWFNGRLSRMRVWSAPRSQAEFAAEQFAANPVITANLWEHWPLTGAGDLAGAVNSHNLAAGTTATTTEDGPPLPEGVTGSATAPLGGPTASATGQRDVTGAANAPLGALGASATGLRDVTGVAAAPLGGLSAHGIASRMVFGAATADLGVVAATATGQRMVAGGAVGALGALSATAAARRTVHGAAVAALGRLIATVVVSDDHDVAVRARLAPQGRLRTRVGARRIRSTLGAQR